MTAPEPRWADNPELPPGVSLRKAVALFAGLQCFGPAAWSLIIIGLASDWQGYGFGSAFGAWLLPLLLAGVILTLATLGALPICRLISMTGYLFMRVFILGFCFLGIALAYGSTAMVPCILATMIGVVVIEFYAWLNVRSMSEQKIIEQMKDAFSEVNDSGRFRLLSHGPGLSEEEMWLKGSTQFRLLSALILLSPFLIALAVTGRSDAISGPIMVTIGLVVYFLAAGSWAGQYALSRAIRMRLTGYF